MNDINRVTPIKLQFCIAYWVSPSPSEDLILGSYKQQIIDETINWMIDNELIESGSRKPTEKLGRYIHYLCAMPLPVQMWVLPGEVQS